MKHRISFIIPVVILFIQVGVSSCNKYLDVVPKGKKIPTTLADFEALLRDEYTASHMNISNAVYLLNDCYETASNLSYSPLSRINYMWEEQSNRITYNNSDESAYYLGYAAISSCNLILEYAPAATEATEAQKNTLIAQAKVNRAMQYFQLLNYYADTYDASTAATKLSVPLITSASVEAPYTQVTIQELYNFILQDITTALPDLPVTGATALHASKGAAYALLARVYLQVNNYDKALENANLALQANNKLFDWVEYYNSYKSQIEQPGVYPSLPTPLGYNCVENYIFMHGLRVYNDLEYHIRTDRTTRFESGDASLLSRWKLRTQGAATYYNSITRGYFNHGGISTPEVYLIQAECLARKNDITGAMQALNAVRVKRILPAVYADASAANTESAVKLIRNAKANVTLFSIVAFADRRRFNRETAYQQTLTKTENGQALSLTPQSHMWTMPFPLGAIKNAGNGSLQQNVNK